MQSVTFVILSLIVLMGWPSIVMADRTHTQQANEENVVHLKKHWVLPGKFLVSVDGTTDESGVTSLGRPKTDVFGYDSKAKKTTSAEDKNSKSAIAVSTPNGNVLMTPKGDGTVSLGPCNGDPSASQTAKGPLNEKGESISTSEAYERMNSNPPQGVYTMLNGILFQTNKQSGNAGGGG